MRPDRWEIRYSSSELFYLEVTADCVLAYLDHSRGRADRITFEDALAGEFTGEVRALFTPDSLEEGKDAVRRRIAARELL